MTHTVLIIGASSEIGQQLASTFKTHHYRVLTCSRSEVPTEVTNEHLSCDLSKPDSVEKLKQWLSDTAIPDIVICCQGILHDKEKMPEKNLKAITADWLHHSVDVNVLPSVHTAQAVNSFITRRRPIRWVSLSAMVGSLQDNELGGWYSYRMTKAALNMFIKNLSIEWSRKSPDSVVVALHPGTTITPLSEPFQATVKPEKLYTAELTANRLFKVIVELTPEKNGQLLHWDGSRLPY